MNRIIIFITLALAALAPQRAAFAGDAPTKDQLEAAKKAFGEGKALYEEGKLPEAVDKFKESYKLSKNPLLLYNIAHTLDQAGDKDTALFYYRKFLADAPKGAAQRKDVTKRVEQIEQEKLEADLNGTTMPKTQTTTTTTKPPEETRPTVKAKPAGTYSATDFEHQMIEAAPPGKPLDVTAFVPEDSGWTVTLYYRGSGDAKFVGKPMKWRYKELVARIPGAKMEGSSIQYYVEAKDAQGNVVTRAGKSTSPNLVNIDATVAPRFYPDLTDDGDEVASGTQSRSDVEEDPLNRTRTRQEVDPETNGGGGRTTLGGDTSVTGPVDTNPNQYSKKKWIATGIAGGLLAGAVLTYVLGSQQASNLLADRDSRMGNTCMQPPCFEFDMYDIDVEKAGKRYNTWHTLTAVTGVIAGGVAAYYWYKERQLRKRRGGGSRPAAPRPPAHDEFAITPAIGNGFAGAAAVGRF